MKKIACSFFVIALTMSAVRAGDDVKVQADVIYGRKDGMALTFDVLSPAKANGAGLLWMQSGGWYSNWTDPKAAVANYKHFLDKGYMVFVVRHASAPKYAVPDAVEDVRRATRFIRMKSGDFGVNPNRLGVMGASAGGHLSLMLGVTGDDGVANTKDPVLKQSNRVAAVCAIFPPTDLRGWTTIPPEVIKKVPQLKPPLTFDEKLESAVSPIVHVGGKNAIAPILLIHGDKDLLVPIEHSHKLMKALEKTTVPSKLVTVEGAAHGFSTQQNTEIVRPAMLDWFDKHLAAKKD